MRRPLIAIVILALLAMVLYVMIRTAGPDRPPPAAAVFDLKYRGFSAPDDPLSYRAYWGFGRPEEPNHPFVEAVKKRVQEFELVCNTNLPAAQWSVVELKDSKPVAFYFDVSADGRVSDDERFLPTAPSGSGFGYPYAFITSDFFIRTPDNREVPFRVMLVGSSYGTDQISYMWSPCCVLEGQASLAGKPVRLVLYTNGFSGSFTTFGECSYALIPAKGSQEEYASRDTLSSLINYEGQFYRLTLRGAHEKGRTLQVVLEHDTTPTGRVAVEIEGQEGLKARLTAMSIDGVADPAIHFGLSNAQSTLPAGQYKLSRGWLSYGLQSDGPWQTDFAQGPGLNIDAGQTSTVALGELTLSVSAVDERERYQSDVKARSSFAQGTPLYLTPQIKGKAGEVYGRFSQRDAGSGNRTDLKPHVTILDQDGKQVASADLEYG